MSKSHQISIAVLILFVALESAMAQNTVSLTVDQAQSFATVSVLGGDDVTSITGDAVLDLGSTSEPFGTAHVTELNLTLADGFSIDFLAGTVTVSVEPGGAVVDFFQIGAMGIVDAENRFDQFGNLFGVTGMSLIEAPIPFGNSEVDLSTVKPVPFDIIDALLELDGDQLTLSVDVNIDFEFDVLGGTAVMNLNGPIVMTGVIEGDALILGDVNCDNEVNLLDVAPFVELITNSQFSEKADVNTDGNVDLLDVQPFVDLLTGG